jgi:hypothetical protein
MSFCTSDYAFDVLGFEKLILANAVGNRASRRIKVSFHWTRCRGKQAGQMTNEVGSAFILAGRMRPHPRHWQVLAEVVGVSKLAERKGFYDRHFP